MKNDQPILQLRARFLLAGLVLATLVACGGGGKGGGNRAPANASPSAQITVSATSGHAPLQVNFDASQSSDNDGTIASYAWDFGDGNTSSGVTTSHIYTGLGVFTAVLSVTDNDGATSTRSVAITSWAQTAGFYFGALSSNAGPVTDLIAFIGANNHFHALGNDIAFSEYWGDLNVTERMVSGTLSAGVTNPGQTFPDGSTYGLVTVSGDVAERQSLTGVYSGLGDTGSLAVQYIPEISEQVFTLADLMGDWTFTDDVFGFSDALSVSATGALVYTASDNCTGEGQLSILHNDLNGFSFDLDLTCPPGLLIGGNGVRSGVGFVDDVTSPETWIVLMGAMGQNALTLAWQRPRPLAVAGTVVAKPASQSLTTTWRSSRNRREIAEVPLTR